MNDFSYNLSQLNDTAIAEAIGHYIRHHRLQQNKTQAQTATAAQISRSTLSLLERGETVTLSTLIRVLRVLGQLSVFSGFAVKQQPSPLALAKLARKERQRASKSTTNTPPETTW